MARITKVLGFLVVLTLIGGIIMLAGVSTQNDKIITAGYAIMGSAFGLGILILTFGVLV